MTVEFAFGFASGVSFAVLVFLAVIHMHDKKE